MCLGLTAHGWRIIELRPEEAHRDGLRCGEQVGDERARQDQPVQQDRDLVLGAANDAAVLQQQEVLIINSRYSKP